jgi:hypothetical protein
MANYAVLDENNVVIDVIVADNKEVAETATQRTCIELPPLNHGVGDIWDGTKFNKPVFIHPEGVPLPPADNSPYLPPAIEG